MCYDERGHTHMNERSRVSSELLGRLTPFRDEALNRGIPATEVERWIAVAARPCVTLSPDGDGPVAGHFGGALLLPPDAPDPYYPFLGSIDFAALPGGATDLPLPDDGRLLLFTYAREDATGGGNGGGGAVYIPADTRVEEREVRYESIDYGQEEADLEAREIVDQYPQEDLRVTVNVSLPSYGYAHVPDYFCNALFRAHPHSEELAEAWEDTRGQCATWGPLQLGGYPTDEYGGYEFTQESSPGEHGNEWVLLADWYPAICGIEGLTVHWPVRWPDLSAGRFDQVAATVFWNP